MGSRYYDPRLGRFLSIDPVEPDENNLHSLNRYAYANNNPYKFTDPDGQAAETVIDVVSLGLSINTFRQDPGFVNGLALAYDGLATAIPFLPGGIGIVRQAASKGETLTQVVKQAADRGAAKAGEKAAEGARTASSGRAGRQERLRELATDSKVASSDRGWIKQEINSIERGSRSSIRNPPGKDLAHERGREAAKGYDYKHSNLQDRDLHRTQHRYDNFGKANKERPVQ